MPPGLCAGDCRLLAQWQNNTPERVMVSAAIIRVHGDEFCELPLAATRIGDDYRKKGHCRRMLKVGGSVLCRERAGQRARDAWLAGIPLCCAAMCCVVLRCG